MFLFVCLFLMHPSEAVPTGCQSRLHGGVGLAVLISTGGSYEHLLSWGGYRSKWACAPLEGGRVVTKLWAAIHSCDRRVGMIKRCVHDVNEDVCKRKDE